MSYCPDVLLLQSIKFYIVLMFASISEIVSNDILVFHGDGINEYYFLLAVSPVVDLSAPCKILQTIFLVHIHLDATRISKVCVLSS